MPQRELANKVGTSRSTIAFWETGRSDPLDYQIAGLAFVLKVTVSYLRTGLQSTGGRPAGVSSEDTTLGIPKVSTVMKNNPFPRGNFHETLAGRIRLLRRQSKMTQGNLGVALNVSRSVIAFWETGRTRVAKRFLGDIAALFQVDQSFLLLGHIGSREYTMITLDERELLDRYRQLAVEDKVQVDAWVQGRVNEATVFEDKTDV